MKTITLALFIFAAAALPVSAQERTAAAFDFVGRVRTQEHRYVSNASVMIVGCNDAACSDPLILHARTNTFGYFKFRALPPNDYIISIRSKSFIPLAAFVPIFEPVDSYRDFILLRASAGNGRTRQGMPFFSEGAASSLDTPAADAISAESGNRRSTTF